MVIVALNYSLQDSKCSNSKCFLGRNSMDTPAPDHHYPSRMLLKVFRHFACILQGHRQRRRRRSGRTLCKTRLLKVDKKGQSTILTMADDDTLGDNDRETERKRVREEGVIGTSSLQLSLSLHQLHSQPHRLSSSGIHQTGSCRILKIANAGEVSTNLYISRIKGAGSGEGGQFVTRKSKKFLTKSMKLNITKYLFARMLRNPTICDNHR